MSPLLEQGTSVFVKRKSVFTQIQTHWLGKTNRRTGRNATKAPGPPPYLQQGGGARGEIEVGLELPLASSTEARIPPGHWFHPEQLQEPRSNPASSTTSQGVNQMNKMQNTHHIIAVDISKEELVTFWGGELLYLPYTKAGMWQIVQKARKLENALVVFEATGGYEAKLRDYLGQAGVGAHLANATRVRDFARSEGIRAKTDPIDARVIYNYAIEKKVQPQSPPSVAQRQLAELMDRRDQLVEECKREKNRLGQARPGTETYSSILRTLRFLQKEAERVGDAVGTLVKETKELSDGLNAMVEVKGVGFWTASAVLAYMPELVDLSRNTAGALAGLAPFNKDSGKKGGRRKVEAGRSKLRKNLYMAARSAARFNPIIKKFVDGLRSRGKEGKVAIVAAMRKLLVCLQSQLKKAMKGSQGELDGEEVGGKGCLGVQGGGGKSTPCV